LSLNTNQYKDLDFDMTAEMLLVNKFSEENANLVNAIGIALESRKFLLPTLGECYFKEISRDFHLLPELFKACPESANVHKFINKNKEAAYLITEGLPEEFNSEDVLELLQFLLIIVKSEAFEWDFSLIADWDEKFYERDMIISYFLNVFRSDGTDLSHVIIAFPLSIFGQHVSMRS
jgi:hypothetical protein